MKSPFFINEVYGLGYWLKDYAYYPKSWPLFTFMDHGMALSDRITPHEVENPAPLIFKFSPRAVKLYKKESRKPVYNIVNPFVHYRRSRKIGVTKEAKGTLFFVAHSTSEIDDLTDWEEYISQLKRIPEQFHPIDVCLHPTDMAKGLDRVFEQHGYKVYTASDLASYRYTINFYDILRNYRYSMSNILGSYFFYSVEMGIPFSLYGEEPKYFNKADKNIEQGNYTSYQHFDTYKKAKALFSGFHAAISPEQETFVTYELGIHDTISRGKACWLVYKALVLFALRQPRTFLNTLRGRYN
ncbi:MAG: hypothetical protein ABW019_17415 [Chitinophagaceae bacterium]